MGPRQLMTMAAGRGITNPFSHLSLTNSQPLSRNRMQSPVYVHGAPAETQDLPAAQGTHSGEPVWGAPSRKNHLVLKASLSCLVSSNPACSIH